MTTTPKAHRGFATFSPEKLKATAAKGGASVPADKRSFSRDPALAARAGTLGGMASRGGGRSRKLPK